MLVIPKAEENVLLFRAISVPLALFNIENKVQRAICCRLSCCSYVVTRIRVLPEEPFFQYLSLSVQLPQSPKDPLTEV